MNLEDAAVPADPVRRGDPGPLASDHGVATNQGLAAGAIAPSVTAGSSPDAAMTAPPANRPMRERRRGKRKALPEPPPATWVMVAPGRFIRVEEPTPTSAPAPEGDGEIAAVAAAPDDPGRPSGAGDGDAVTDEAPPGVRDWVAEEVMDGGRAQGSEFTESDGPCGR